VIINGLVPLLVKQIRCPSALCAMYHNSFLKQSHSSPSTLAILAVVFYFFCGFLGTSSHSITVIIASKNIFSFSFVYILSNKAKEKIMQNNFSLKWF
jgi:hypothetical protein